jgi:peptidyl-prolyl cis-trans isomerase B (cyclophilin B)
MFRKNVIAILSSIVLLISCSSNAQDGKDNNAPQVKISTNMGDIVLELDYNKAPISVKNFLSYVDEGFYDGTIFHRIIPNFMVQGGGFTKDFTKKKTHAPILNEADNGLYNRIGTVAMARTSDPHSATGQFFINVSQNSFLDFREKQGRGWGYAVFGKVIKGMKVVNKIRQVRTGFRNGMKDVPQEDVIILKATHIGGMTYQQIKNKEKK